MLRSRFVLAVSVVSSLAVFGGSGGGSSAFAQPKPPAPNPPTVVAAPRIPYSVAALGPYARYIAQRGAPRTGPNLSMTPQSSHSPRIAASGNDVYVVYVDMSVGQGDVFLAVSNDAGASFWPPINVSRTTTRSSQPRVAVVGRKLAIGWFESVPGLLGVETAAMVVVGDDGENRLGAPIRLNGSDPAQEFELASGDGGYLGAIYTTREDGHTSYLMYRDLATTSSSLVESSRDTPSRLRLERTAGITYASWVNQGEVRLASQLPGGKGWMKSPRSPANEPTGRHSEAILDGSGRYAAWGYDTTTNDKRVLTVVTSAAGYFGLSAAPNFFVGQLNAQYTYPAGARGLQAPTFGDVRIAPDGHVVGAYRTFRPNGDEMLEYVDIDASARSAAAPVSVPLRAPNLANVMSLVAATNASTRFVAIAGTLDGKKQIGGLRVRGSAVEGFYLGPAAGMESRENPQIAATNSGAVVVWEAGPRNAEDIHFYAIPNLP